MAVLGGEAGDDVGSVAVERGDHQFDLTILKTEEGQALSVMTEISGAEAVSEGTWSAAESGYLPDSSVGFCGRRRVIDQRAGIGRPAGGLVVYEIPRDLNGNAAAEKTNPELSESAHVAGEGDGLAVRGDGGKFFHPGKVSEALEVRRLRGRFSSKVPA